MQLGADLLDVARSPLLQLVRNGSFLTVDRQCLRVTKYSSRSRNCNSNNYQPASIWANSCQKASLPLRWFP